MKLDLQVGQAAFRAVTVTEAKVRSYAEMSGDFNPLHFDKDFAARASFGRLVAQGGLTTGILHALVAQDLPGPGSVFFSQDWKFTAPVFIGDTITGFAEVLSVHASKPVCQLRTKVEREGGETVLEGEAWGTGANRWLVWVVCRMIHSSLRYSPNIQCTTQPEEEMNCSNVRRGAPLMVAVLLAAFTACGGDDPVAPGGGDGGGGGGGTTPVATTSVSITSGLAFEPPAISVIGGATVTWTWANSTVHNVTFAAGSITSSGDQGGGTYSTAMPATAGTYSYGCTIHPSMTGTVQVQ